MKSKLVFQEGCFQINLKNLTVDRYYKKGGFRDRIQFKSKDSLIDAITQK